MKKVAMLTVNDQLFLNCSNAATFVLSLVPIKYPFCLAAEEDWWGE